MCVCASLRNSWTCCLRPADAIMAKSRQYEARADMRQRFCHEPRRASHRKNHAVAPWGSCAAPLCAVFLRAPWAINHNWDHSPLDPGGKIRACNWKLAGQAVSNCKYEFSNTCLSPRPDALWASSWVLKRPGPGPVRGSGEGVRNKNSADFPPRPAWIPSDPVRIQSQKMHQIQAKSITHDIAPPRIPSDPARIPSDPVA